MRNLRTPGVYIREVEVKPPARLRLDITGFVGQAERGPLNFPQPLTGWGEYLDVFGDFIGHGYLPYSVFSFFANGGEKCYVVRVAHKQASKAELLVGGHTFSISEQALKWLESDGVPKAVLDKLAPKKDQEFRGEAEFTSMLEKTIGAEETAKYKPNFLKRANKPLIRVEAINEGEWGNGIEVVAESESTDELTITELKSDLTLGSPMAHFKSVEGLRDEIEGEVEGDQVKLIHPRIPTQQEQAVIKSINYSDGTVVFKEGVSRPFPAGSRVLGKGFKLTFRYIRKGKLVRGELFNNLSMDPAHERYFVRVINGDPEEPDYIKRIRAGNSILARVADLHVAGANARERVARQTGNLSNAKEGKPKKVRASYFTGYEAGGYFRPPPPAGLNQEAIGKHKEKLFGMAAYEAVEEIGLVAIPDLIVPDLYAAVPAAQIPEQGIIFAAAPKGTQEFKNLKDGQVDMLSHCQKMGERFAILDSPRGVEFGRGATRIEDWPISFQLLSGARYGALYYPWVKQKKADFGGRELFVPPCGSMAGVYSRAEQARGVGKAPANEVLEGAVELEFCLSDAEQAVLNPKGVNCLRIFPGRGLRVWGARTLSPDPLSMYVNMRRVALAIIKNILVNLRWTVFEPNGQQLWNKITATLKLFLNGLFEAGALAGARPEEAFFVKCDEETNPPESIDLGRVVTEIGFAPERPAEFILVTIKRTPGALSVSER